MPPARNLFACTYYPSIRSVGGIHWLLYFCSVKLFSAVAGPIGTKFVVRHEPDASQVLRDFGDATPRDSEIIAQNVRFCPLSQSKISQKCE